ncbi:MAG: DUF4199 family protein [Flavobacteriaceae bacterium]|nr:MAG: DUF4199 family protein [Flavobacteriaceae bacterium]
MENQASSKSVILNYGLYYGVISILISLVVYAMGKHLDQGFSGMLIGLVVMIVFIVLATKKFKKDNNGFMSWGQGVKVGVGTVVIGVIIAVIYQQIFINFIEPDFMNQMAEKTQESLLDAGLTEEQIESRMEMQKKFQNPLISIPLGIVVGAFAGFIFSAITSAIMKKSEEDQY